MKNDINIYLGAEINFRHKELMICNFVMDEEERERETRTGQKIS